MMMMMLMGMKCAVAFTLQFSKAIEERETILMKKKLSTGLDNDDDGHIAMQKQFNSKPFSSSSSYCFPQIVNVNFLLIASSYSCFL